MNLCTGKKGNWKVNLAILWCVVFFVCASYTMVIPFLPLFLLKELALPPVVAKLWSGAIIAVTFIIASFMAPYWGARGDVIGQKKNALRAGGGLTLCYFLSSLVQTPMQLLWVRVLTGIICGCVPACMTIVSTTLPQERMGWGMGLMQTANASGSIMGPLLGGLLSTWFSMRTSFFVAGLSLLIATCAIYFFVYEKPREQTATTPQSTKFKDLFVDLRQSLHNKTLLYIMGIFALLKACYMIIQPLLALYVNDLLHGAPEAVRISGFILSLAGIAGIIAAPFWGRKGQKYGFVKILSLVMVCAGVVSMCQIGIHGIWGFSLCYFIYGLFLAGAQPNVLSYMVSSVDMNERGKAFGLSTSADQLGGALGPLLGGLLGTVLSMSNILGIVGIILICGGYHIYRSKVQKTI